MLGKSTFEISLLRDGRWIIDCYRDDEAEALLQARNLLTSGLCDEVKVMKGRDFASGAGREIFRQARTVNVDKSIVLSADATGAPVCQTLADIESVASRQIIGRMLRGYLDKTGQTVMELIYCYPSYRKLADQGTLLPGAMAKAAIVHGQMTGANPKNCAVTLDKLRREVVVLAQDFAATRRGLPRFDEPIHFEYNFQRLRAKVGVERYDYSLRAAFCWELMEQPSLLGRLDKVLSWAALEVAPPVRLIFDKLMADCLASGEVIQEVFGDQPNLASFLCSVARMIEGTLTPEKMKTMDPLAARLLAQIQAGQAPECIQVLTDRLVREISSNRPLNRHDPEGEKRTIMEVQAALTQVNGQLIGGKATAAALELRRLRLRQDQLRALGMHEAADALGARFHGEREEQQRASG